MWNPHSLHFGSFSARTASGSTSDEGVRVKRFEGLLNKFETATCECEADSFIDGGLS